MVSSSVGAEYELNLVDSDGYLVNNADEILNDPRNDGSFTYEALESMIEVNSKPAKSIVELEEDVTRQFLLLEKICKDYGVRPVPVSEFGAGEGKLRIHRRTPIYLLTMGLETLRELSTISGIHLHISQHPGRELDQFNLMYSLDPISYVGTSTTPVNYQGVNTLNNHRIRLTRDRTFKDFPLHAQLQEFPRSLKEIDRRNNLRRDNWRDICLSKGMTKEYFDERFQPDNTGYAPVRKRDKIGKTGTNEGRNFDSAPISDAHPIFAIFKGANDRMINEQIPVYYATRDGHYKYSPEGIILPTLKTRRDIFQQEGTEKGLQSDEIHKFYQEVLNFAIPGMSKEDREVYVPHLENMLLTRMNPADYIMQHLRNLGYQGHVFNPEQMAKVNLFVRERHRESLEKPF